MKRKCGKCGRTGEVGPDFPPYRPGRCRDCAKVDWRESSRRRYQAHRAERIARNTAYWASNREEYNAARRERRHARGGDGLNAALLELLRAELRRERPWLYGEAS